MGVQATSACVSEGDKLICSISSSNIACVCECWCVSECKYTWVRELMSMLVHAWACMCGRLGKCVSRAQKGGLQNNRI